MVAEVFGNVLGNLFGGFMGQQANAQGVLLSAQQQKELMNHQAKVNWKYYQKELQNRWQLARQGLEKGNYNPMLALSGFNGNSSWTNQASISDTGAGTAFNAGMANAQGVAQLRQQAQLNDSTINLNNSESMLKQNQAVTEMFTQLEKQNNADYINAKKKLADKDLSWYDKQQYREDMRVYNEIERTKNDYKIGMANAIANQVSASANQVSSNANAYDIYENRASTAQQQKEYNEWAKKHPYLKSFDQTLTRYLSPGAAGGAGYYAGSKAPTRTHLKKPVGFK